MFLRKREEIRMRMNIKTNYFKIAMIVLIVFFVLVNDNFVSISRVEAASKKSVTLDNGQYPKEVSAIKDGDKIYCFVSNKGLYVYNLKTEKSRKVMAAKYLKACIYKYENNVYIAGWKADEKIDLKIYNTSTKKSKLLLKNTLDTVVSNGYIVSAQKKKGKVSLIRQDYNGKNKKILIEDFTAKSNRHITKIDIRNGCVYYALDGMVLMGFDASVMPRIMNQEYVEPTYYKCSLSGKISKVSSKNFKKIISDYGRTNPEKSVKGNVSSSYSVKTAGKSAFYYGTFSNPSSANIYKNKNNKEKILRECSKKSGYDNVSSEVNAVFKKYMVYTVSNSKGKKISKNVYVMSLDGKKNKKIF